MDSDKVKSFISNLVNRLNTFINTIKKLFMNIVNYLKDYIIKKNNKNKRIVYLIKHSKKYRIRKKNLHRLMRC
ncbi:hypothetical protein [Clostridium perfringens]|uniref:hypothetical protein n=1 Tax=Clostridium perfringens TaxID=1502 RepID=UPI0024BC609F|nr:hypothetical protein [Clostridium perfringens]